MASNEMLHFSDKHTEEANASKLKAWVADVKVKYEGARASYSVLADEFHIVGSMYNHAELVVHRIIVDDDYEGTLAYLERDLYDEAKAAKRELFRKWKPLEEHSATHGFTAWNKEKVLECRRAVDTARTLMLSNEVAYWTAKIKSLYKQEENAARNAKIVKAMRTQKHSRVAFWEAHGAMCKAGGGTRSIMHLMKRPFSEERMEEIKRTLYDRVDEWETEQKQRGEALVADMVVRVIKTVRLRIIDEDIETYKSKIATARRERKVHLEELDRAMQTLQSSSSPPPPAPEVAVAVAVEDPKAKALEAVRKLNREKALKTETLLAQRKRTAKALEAEEKLAEAAAARAAAKGRVSR